MCPRVDAGAPSRLADWWDWSSSIQNAPWVLSDTCEGLNIARAFRVASRELEYLGERIRSIVLASANGSNNNLTA